MALPKLSKGAVIALATAGVLLTLVTAGLIATQTITSTGIVTTINVGVYTDNECTENCTLISWGILYPGESTNTTIYVKNTGTCPITISMTPESWEPANASDCLTLIWDQEGEELDPDEFVAANLRLSANLETGNLRDFSFDIVITGTE